MTDREFSQALAGGGEDGVGHGGRDGRHGSFPYASGVVVGFHYVHVYPRHFIDSQNVVGVEVALLDAAFVDGDFAFKGGRETEDDAAFDLLTDDGGVHDVPAIDRAGYAMHPELAAGDGDFGDLRVETAYVVHHGDSLEVSGGRFTPSGSVRRFVEDR